MSFLRIVIFSVFFLYREVDLVLLRNAGDVSVVVFPVLRNNPRRGARFEWEQVRGGHGWLIFFGVLVCFV